MNNEEFKIPAINELLFRLASIENKLNEIAQPISGVPKLLNTNQAARALGISLRTLQERRKRHEIGFLQYGDIIRFRPEDIQEYLKAHFIKSDYQKGGRHE